MRSLVYRDCRLVISGRGQGELVERKMQGHNRRAVNELIVVRRCGVRRGHHLRENKKWAASRGAAARENERHIM
jgi:hypothetical protein